MQFGIITTHWMCEKFCETINNREDASVVAVYSRDLKRAEEFAKEHEISDFYDNYDIMLENEEIDAIYVSSPNYLHFEHSLKAIKSKKHVLIEKPITLNVVQLKKLYDAAKENGVYFLEAYKPLHLEEFKILHEEVEKLEDISYASFIQLQYSSKYEDFLNGIDSNAFNAETGGALYDIGIYPLYYPIIFWGAPIGYTYNQHLLENGVDGTGTISLKYKDFIVDVTYSKTVDGVNESYIYAKNNTLKMKHVSNLKCVEKNGICLAQDDNENKLYGEVNTFIDIINNRDDDAFEYFYQLSYEVIKIIEEVRENIEII